MRIQGHNLASPSYKLAKADPAIVQDCSIELTIGRRYGLLGSNGSGKSNFLQCLAAREACSPLRVFLDFRVQMHAPHIDHVCACLLLRHWL